MSAFRHRMIVRRDSPDEETFAVICWNGVEPDALLPALRRALREWQQTPEGREAWECSSHDFNLGDLSNESCHLDPLCSILARHGIRELEIEVHSCDFTMYLSWTYDVSLMDHLSPAEES